MIAALLRNVDGDFNYPAAMLCIILLVFSLNFVWMICRALLQGRVPSLGSLTRTPSRRFPRPIRFHERAIAPLRYWLVIAMLGIFLALFTTMIMVIGFGLLRKAG